LSQVETVEIKCPKCGHNDKVDVFRALNASVDPELKQDLMEGKMNFFECPVCRTSGFIPSPFVYHDMELEIFIHYFPLESLSDVELEDIFSPDGKVKLQFDDNPAGEIPEYIRSAKIVFSMEELVRYIRFRDKLSNVYDNQDEPL